ncbi:MAG TPA: serine/threonine-protein kinase [Kofleriaceae bacterium]|nr:serine/threonine-protein kinase [Kofleriaceae bacterium]
MTTLNPKYFCPRCRAAYDVDHNYCGRCGADMHHASRLQRALLLDEDSGSHARARSTSDSESGRLTVRADEAARLRDRRNGGRDPWLGRVIDGRYRVVDVIGRGGMGVVYKVEHQRMGKIAAMKVLHGDLAGDKEVTGRFRREAEAVSRLTHPNTVQVFDFGTAQGQLYLVMEYVRGLDLGTLIERDGPILFERAGPLFSQVCAALGEAHELGVVHRDLKPENILVTRTHGGHDFVKVLDFGLAKLAEREDIAAATGRGAIVGTPHYMSPEQIRGEDEVDARTDIYSLGALMYRVLTGEHAFSAASPVGVLTKHLTEQVVPPSRRVPTLGIPDEADEIVLRAMRKQPAERYPSVRELANEIDQASDELYGHSASTPRRQRVAAAAAQGVAAAEIDYDIDSERRLRRADLDEYERSLQRRRWVAMVSLPLCLAGAGWGIYYYLSWRAEQPQRVEVERNDDLAHATLIGTTSPVTGWIGRRISREKSDRDFYRLREVPDAGGGDRVTVEVSALPNIDVGLYLYQADGRLVAQADEGGIGSGEGLRWYRVRGPVVVMVSEVRRPNALPTENVSDSYRLTVGLVDRSAARDAESEPNDAPTDAVPLAADARVRGYLDRRDDVDIYRYDGPAGRQLVRVRGAGAVPIDWQVGARTIEGREQEIDLAPGDLVRLARADRGLARGQALPGADDAYELEISGAASPPPARDR